MKHGETKSGGYRSPEYVAWTGMKQRCGNPRCASFRRYGGRGIRVCKRWMHFPSFLADMGRRPTPSHSIERINNDLGYEPGNCRWATRAEQSRNMRSNHRVSGGIVTDVAMSAGLDPSTLIKRLKDGMDIKLALSKPVRAVTYHRITIEGVTKSAAAWAEEMGISPTTVYSRLKIGIKPETAVVAEPGAIGVGRKPSVQITHDGTTRTIAEWSETTGIKANTIRERLRLHPEWPTSKILST